MDSPLSDVVEGYARLGSWLVESWGAQASKVGKKLDAVPLTRDYMFDNNEAA